MALDIELKLDALRHPHLGLLFTELYQTIRHGVPTSGILFPAASRLAMPPMPNEQGSFDSAMVSSGEVPVETGLFLDGVQAEASKRDRSEAVKRARYEYIAEINARLAQIQAKGYQGYKLILATSTPSASGVTSACASVFEQVREKGQVAIWLDMNDVSSTDDLFEQLLDAASFRIGAGNLLPAYVSKHPELQAEEIILIANSTATDWLFFLQFPRLAPLYPARLSSRSAVA